MILKIIKLSASLRGKYIVVQNKDKIIVKIDKNKLLVLIESADNIKGAIYDIKSNKIISFVER